MSVRRVAGWFALAWAAAVAAYFLLGPAYRWATSAIHVSAEQAPTRVEATGTATLLAVNGPRALIALLLPVLLTALPLLARRPATRRRLAGAAAVLLGVFVLLGAASVGLFYLPAALALVLAAVASDGASTRAAV
ncbi:MAG TPA: hypothetical protein VFS44_09090 [Gemmatimonadaceae bacterium]|nr:hypothetical protein [Gemmatimonadaceae bacterium]